MYVAGWNQPGYLPDDEVAEFDTFDEAKRYIIGEIEYMSEDAETEEDSETYSSIAEDVNLESGPFSIMVGDWAFWVARE